MKSTFLPSTIALLFIGFSMSAQTGKGTFRLGLQTFSPYFSEIARPSAFGIGSGTYTIEGNTSANRYTYTTVGISGRAQYFIIDRLAAGIQLNALFSSQKLKNADNQADASLLTLVGPEVRYYIPVSARYQLWLSGGGGWGLNNPVSGAGSYAAHLSYANGSAGLAVFVHDRIALDIGLGYGYFIYKDYQRTPLGEKVLQKNTRTGVLLDFGFSAFL